VISLIFFSLVGTGLLFLLVLVARRAARPEGSAQALLDAKQALRTLQGDLLPAGLVERIFANQDFDYIIASAPHEVQRLFLQERKRVAVCWAQQVHAGVLRLMNFHLMQARFYAQLSVATEVKLAANFAALLLACRVMQAALYLGGPFASPSVVGRTVSSAARLCEASGKSLAFLDAPRLDRLAKDPASRPAAL
jgi:hypothetical protein